MTFFVSLKNWLKYLSKLGAYTTNEVRRNFTEEGRYLSSFATISENKKWVIHSLVTEKYMKAIELEFFIQSIRLVYSISSSVKGESVIIETNLEYSACINQFSKRHLYDAHKS